MTESKRARGIPTPRRAVQRARRKILDLGEVFKIKHEHDDTKAPGGRVPPAQGTGRRATRATKHGRGFEKPWRSRMQRTRRRPRTGGWK